MTQQNIQVLRKAVGVVTVGHNVCMASLVEGTLLTARHCFGISGAANDTEVIAEFVSLDGTVQFQSKQNLKEARLEASTRDKDWIALKLTDAGPASQSLLFAPQLAQRWQPLIFLSVSGYAQALANDSTISSGVIRIDISPKCVVQAREGRFIYHSCQTLHGMSGAPLLTMVGDQLAVVGVHDGVSTGMGSKCSAMLSKRYINYGVVPSSLSKAASSPN